MKKANKYREKWAKVSTNTFPFTKKKRQKYAKKL